MHIKVSAFHYKITLPLSNSISCDGGVPEGHVGDLEWSFHAFRWSSVSLYTHLAAISTVRVSGGPTPATWCIPFKLPHKLWHNNKKETRLWQVFLKHSVSSPLWSHKRKNRLVVILQTQKLNCCESLLSYNWQRNLPPSQIWGCVCVTPRVSVCHTTVQTHTHTHTLYMLNQLTIHQTNRNCLHTCMFEGWVLRVTPAPFLNLIISPKSEMNRHQESSR